MSFKIDKIQPKSQFFRGKAGGYRLLLFCKLLILKHSISPIVIYLKLPDCIIMAKSLWLNMTLISADQDFKKIEFEDLILFERKQQSY